MARASHLGLAVLASFAMAGASAYAQESDQEASAATGKTVVRPLEEITTTSFPAKAKTAETGEVRLDFGAAPSDDGGFLMFRDPAVGEATDTDDSKGFEWQARASGTTLPANSLAGNSFERGVVPGEAWLLSSFTPRSANAHLSLSYGPESDEDSHKRLGIELSSSISVVPVDVPGVVNNASLREAFNRQEYNVGLNIGYQGFNLGASMRREYGVFSDGYEGFDVGLSYRAASWSTSLSVGEYRRKFDSILGTEFGEDNSFYAFELGASFQLARALKLSGGVRHFEYGGEYNLLERDGVVRSQIFYLGTRLNF